jgi:hypothetical protein
MKLRVFVLTFFILNFCLLLIQNRCLLEINTEYIHYLSSLDSTPYHQNIANQKNYCELVQAHQSSHHPKKVLFTDLPPTSALKSLLSKHFTLTNTNHYTEMDRNSSPYEYLSPSITLFYISSTNWHSFHIAGVHFLCEGQAYNHIPGDSTFSLSKGFREKAKLYYQIDLFSRVFNTYDLTDFLECEEFIEFAEGFYAIKNEENEGIKLELTPQGLETFKKALRKEEKCPLSKRYAQANLLTAEFYLNCYVLWFPYPFKVYFSPAFAELGGFSEYIFLDKLEQAYGSEVYNKIIVEAQHTVKHYLRSSTKHLMPHPRAFEVLHFQFTVDHTYFPWLSDVDHFDSFDHINKEIEQIYHKTHISAIELAFNQLLGFDFETTFPGLFTQIC